MKDDPEIWRRYYHSNGPNDTWHVDGYDKLKPYGFPIHGCIDGFSRKIIWLKVCRTNNDPKIPASFFIQSVQHFKFCPSKVQTDCGTENGILAALQCALVGSADAHRYGNSPSNQRIENWWSHNKRLYMAWVRVLLMKESTIWVIIFIRNVHGMSTTSFCNKS